MRRPNAAINPEAVAYPRNQTASGNQVAGVEKFHCELVTPMYGGGVRAGEVDKEMPIRASGIRGQLRFWWRVACGPFTSSKEMFRRETAIWGGIASAGPTASKVGIRVTCSPAKPTEFCSSDSETTAGIKYAFGPAAINGVAAWLKPGYTFEFILRYPECQDFRSEVETALHWWASFGGLGARTRRGFGAFRVDGIAPVTSGMVEAVFGKLNFHGNGSLKNAELEWKKAIGKLFEFRQGSGKGRRNGNQTPGRSYWPEPDQIRRFTGKDAHGKHIPVHLAGNVFPRAAFGLPITFEFKGTPGEPPKLELLPDGGQDRMASPLILRPYWTGDIWKAAALLLPGWEKALCQSLIFEGFSYHPAHWPTNNVDKHQKAIHIQPMKKNNVLRADDPLSAFMHYFEQG